MFGGQWTYHNSYNFLLLRGRGPSIEAGIFEWGSRSLKMVTFENHLQSLGFGCIEI